MIFNERGNPPPSPLLSAAWYTVRYLEPPAPLFFKLSCVSLHFRASDCSSERQSLRIVGGGQWGTAPELLYTQSKYTATVRENTQADISEYI